MEHQETHFERITRAEKESPEGYLSLELQELLQEMLTANPADFGAAWEEITPGVIQQSNMLEAAGLDELSAITGAKTFARTWLYRQAVLRHGPQVYVPTLDLAKRLQQTHIDNLKCSDLRLPFRAVYVQVPKDLGYEVHDRHTGYHRVEGVYFVEEIDPRGWRALVVGASKDGPLDDTTMDARIDLNLGQRLFRDALEDVREDVKNPTVRHFLHEAWTESAESSKWVDIMEWAARVVLYASCADARRAIRSDVNPTRKHLDNLIRGSSKRKRRDKLAARREQHMPWRRIFLGGDETASGTHTSALLQDGHWVQGHFQHYHTKAGRILKWKEPFWKGPGDAVLDPAPTERIMT